jgi:hypothetical protein
LLLLEREPEREDHVIFRIEESGESPCFEQTVELAPLRNYRSSRLHEGPLKVSYIFSRDVVRLDFGDNGPNSLIVGRQAFEEFLGAV